MSSMGDGGRRWTVGAASAAMGMAALGVGAIAVAPSASAATLNVMLECAGEDIVYADPDDTLVFTMGDGCAQTIPDPNVPGGTTDDSPDWGIFNYNGTSDATITESGFLDYVSDNGNCYDSDSSDVYANDWSVYQSVNLALPCTVTTTLLAMDGTSNPLGIGSVVSHVSADSNNVSFAISYGGPVSSNPPGELQSYQRSSTTAACMAGWSASWAQWPSDGQGGWVCNREVFWNSSTQDWGFSSAVSGT